MNIVKVLVFMPAMTVFSSTALTLCFGLAGRDHTFDGRAFHVLLQKDSSLGLGLMFRGLVFGFCLRVLF